MDETIDKLTPIICEQFLYFHKSCYLNFVQKIDYRLFRHFWQIFDVDNCQDPSAHTQDLRTTQAFLAAIF
jgi:hypothetical protein